MFMSKELVSDHHNLPKLNSMSSYQSYMMPSLFAFVAQLTSAAQCVALVLVYLDINALSVVNRFSFYHQNSVKT